MTFTAIVTPGSGSGPTGTVQFKIDGSNAGSPVTLSGGTAAYSTVALAAGNHSITAVYSGNANFAGSMSSTVTQTADQLTWNAKASGNWTSSNWTGAGPAYPTAAVDTIVSTAYAVTVNSTQAAYSLEVSGNGQVSVTSGGTLTVAAAATVSSSSAIDVLSGGTVALDGLAAGSGSGSIYLNAGTLQAGAAFTTAVPITIDSGGGAVNTNGNSVTIDAAGAAPAS